MRNYNSNQQQKGLTLIELLISVVLGVIVILGVTQGLVAMSFSSRVQNDNATLQSDADSALSYLSFKMRNALSTPCERLSILSKAKKIKIHPLGGSVNNGDGGSENIEGEEVTTINNLIKGTGIAVTSKTLSNSIGDVTAPQTDDITIIAADERLYPSENVDYTSDSISIDGLFPRARGSNRTLYVITDCANMDVFRARRSENETKKTTKLTLSSAAIKRKYPAGSSMVSTLDVSQFIVDNKRRLINKTLFKTSPGPLMDNVELIRVIFGVDNDEDGITDQYITANQLDSFSTSDVISADIYIMVRIPRSNNDVPESYTLAMPNTSSPISDSDNFMQTFTITDRIQRKVFMRSVAFRNNAVVYK